jgi:hypothetical protein
MTTEAITPLRQRMIEDMNARKLCAGTQRGHIRSCKRFAAFLKRVSRDGHVRGHPPVPAAVGGDGREHLHPQRHHDRVALLVPGDAAAV